MMTTVMRVFPCYNIKDILSMPICHFKSLFSMAERAATLNSWDTTVANAALQDESLSKSLQNVVKSGTEVDRTYYNNVISEENKQRVIERINTRRANG